MDGTRAVKYVYIVLEVRGSTSMRLQIAVHQGPAKTCRNRVIHTALSPSKD